MSDEQARGQLLSCLEDVKLDLEELGEVSSSIMVGQAVEMIHELAARLEVAEAKVANYEKMAARLEPLGFDDYAAYTTQLKAENDRAAVLLSQVGRHLSECAFLGRTPPMACDCGVREWLDARRARQ